MDKKILNEVYRLQSLMGIKRQLVMEAPVNPKPIAELMADFFKRLSSTDEKSAKGLLGDFFYTKLNRVMDDDLYRLIKNGELTSHITELEAKELQNFVRENMSNSMAYKEIFTPILQQSTKEKLPFIKEFSMDVLFPRIKQMEDRIFNEIDPAKKAAQIEFANKVYRDIIESLEKEYPNAGLREALIEEVEKLTKRKISGIRPKQGLYDEFLSTLNKQLDKTQIGYFLENFRRWIDLFKSNSTKKLYNELEKLEKEIKDLTDRGLEVPPGKLARATSIIFTLRGSVDETIDIIINNLISDGYITKEFAEQIKSGPKFKDFVEKALNYGYVDAEGKEIAAGFGWTASMEEVKAIAEAIYGSSIIGPLLRNFTKEKRTEYFKNVFEDIYTGLKRNVSAISTLSFRYPSEVLILRNTVGQSKLTLLGGWLFSRVAKTTILPFYASFIALMWQGIVELGDMFTKENLHQWGQEDFGPNWKYSDWFWNKMNEYGFLELFNFHGSKDINIIKDVLLFWTTIDEAITKIEQLLLIGDNAGAKEEIEKLKKQFSDLVTKMETELGDINQKTKEQLEDAVTKFEQLKQECLTKKMDICDKIDETLVKLREALGKKQSENNKPPTESYEHESEFKTFLGNSKTPRPTQPFVGGLYYDSTGKTYIYNNGTFTEF
jgi:hypothetical protein